MCKDAGKKIPFVIRYVSDPWKTQKFVIKPFQKMVDLYNLFLDALKFFPEGYMTQKRCNTYYSTMKFAPDCYKAQEMCNKAADRYFLHLFMFLINIKLEKSLKAISEDRFLKVYCPDKDKPQNMCNGAVDYYLVALKFYFWLVCYK